MSRQPAESRKPSEILAAVAGEVELPIPVLYIGGSGRSGSTVLDTILGNHPEIESVGELVNLVQEAWIDGAYCSCRKPGPECPFWSRVRERWEAWVGDADLERYRHLARRFGALRVLPSLFLKPGLARSADFQDYRARTVALFAAIRQVSGRPWVVDSSKQPARAASLAMLPELDLHLLHLIRDGRGVAWSLMKSFSKDTEQGLQKEIRGRSPLRGSIFWGLVNLGTDLAVRKAGAERSLRLRYEDLCADPSGRLRRIGRWVGLEMDDLCAGLEEGEAMEVGHCIAGNRLRMAGAVRFRPDVQWLSQMPRKARRTVWLTVAPLLWRYGYPRRPAPPMERFTPTAVEEPTAFEARRLALFIGTMEMAGAERQFAQLAVGLGSRGHHVDLVTVVPGGPLWEELQGRPEIRLRSLFTERRPGPRAALGRLWGGAARLRRLLREQSVEVLYSALYLTNLTAARAVGRRDSPAFALGLRASDMRVPLKESLFFRLGPWASRRADLLLANSASGLAFHEGRGYRAPRHGVIPNGIDAETFQPDPEGARRWRRELGVDEGNALVGVVARLHPMKDHATFLRAARSLLDAGRSVRFVCAGKDARDYRPGLEAMTRDLGLQDDVLWLGHVEDLAAFYSALDLCCLPSAYGEGFSNSVAEAMACEIPCVVTDVGDSAALVGTTGRVVPTGDAEALAAGLGELLDEAPELRRRRAEEARRRIVEEFSVERSVLATEAALCSLIPSP